MSVDKRFEKKLSVPATPREINALVGRVGELCMYSLAVAGLGDGKKPAADIFVPFSHAEAQEWVHPDIEEGGFSFSPSIPLSEAQDARPPSVAATWRVPLLNTSASYRHFGLTIVAGAGQELPLVDRAELDVEESDGHPSDRLQEELAELNTPQGRAQFAGYFPDIDWSDQSIITRSEVLILGRLAEVSITPDTVRIEPDYSRPD